MGADWAKRENSNNVNNGGRWVRVTGDRFYMLVVQGGSALSITGKAKHRAGHIGTSQVPIGIG